MAKTETSRADSSVSEPGMVEAGPMYGIQNPSRADTWKPEYG